MTENGTVRTVKPDWFPAEPYRYWELYLGLAQIVNSKPEGYKYGGYGTTTAKACLYWHPDDSEPGCIIGHLLAQLGAPADFLTACDAATRSSGLDNLIEVGMLDGLFEPHAALALRHLQRRQDGDHSWAQALDSMVDFWSGLRALDRYNQDRQR